MQMDTGLDTGPVFTARALAIGPNETGGELAERLASLAAVVVREDLPRAVAGDLAARPQDETQSSHAPLITKAHTRVDWSASALEIVQPYPGHGAAPGRPHQRPRQALAPHPRGGLSGRAPRVLRAPLLWASDGEILVATGDGSVEVLRAQLEGKKELGAADLLNGRALGEGDCLN